MKKTRKVFDLGLYVDWAVGKVNPEETLASIINWAFESHGKTEEEMIKNDKQVADEWMKEVEVDVELTEHEIEVLKALKVLGFEWIARDCDNTLFAYVSKPFKKGAYFEGNGGNNTGLEKDLFEFISWEDEEPTSIDELKIKGE